MKDILIKEYNNIIKNKLQPKKNKNIFICNFINGAFLEIKGNIQDKYIVSFKDIKNNKIIHQSEIENNMWTKTNIRYCLDWSVEVLNKRTNQYEYKHIFNPEGKLVYISLESSAIGDTLAWFPYIEEFRKKWNCKIITSTFHNDWFKSLYPEIIFTEPGTVVENIYAMFNIGWFYKDSILDMDKHPNEIKSQPLQKTASDILNLEYKEIKPNINVKNIKSNFDKKYVVIAPHASAHAKYWNYPDGWQSIIDYLNSIGYNVVMLTQEKLGDLWHDSKLGGTLTGVIDKTGNLPIQDRFTDILNADLFIGVGSGLSWVSWALNTPTILISGFSEPYTEFNGCERIFNDDKNICTGCFNKFKLDPSDWEWCPNHKNTERMFECTKTIKPSQIIERFNKILNIY
jgi:autotransporter strand-loop-strand O-heptosyltransferase